MLNSISAALVTRLGSDAALNALLGGAGRVYDSDAPQSVAPPYVIFGVQADTPETLDPCLREDIQLLIKAVSAASMAAAGNVAARVDALMDNQPLTVTGLRCLWLRRASGVRAIEHADDGTRYWHAGAVYRLRLAHDG